MRYQVIKVNGLNSDLEAALAQSFEREDAVFLAALSLNCDDAFGRGRQLVAELADLYFASEGSVADNLKSVFEEAQKKLTDVESFSILFAGTFGKTLYLIGHGQIKVFLVRETQVLPLLEQGSGSLLSGFLKEGDRVFLATSNLINTLGERLKSILELPLEACEEELVSRLGQGEPELERPLAAAGLVLEAQSEETVLAETTPPLIQPATPQETADKIQRLNLSEVKSQALKLVPQGSKARLVLAIILIIIIGLGAGLKYKAIKDNQSQQRFNQLVRQANEDFNTASGLITLNPSEAENKLASAKFALDQALKIKPNDPMALDLKSKIAQSSPSSQSAIFNEYLDLNLITQGFRVKNLSLSNGQLLIVNQADHSVVEVDLGKKSHQILAGQAKLGQSLLASISDQNVYAYSPDKGVLKIDTSKGGVSSVAETDSDWGNIVDIAGFGGNVYLLDTKANQIWKYLPITGGFSDKRKYLGSQVKTNLSGALRMQIESSVYILKPDGAILRFTKGEPDNFSLSGLPSGIKNPKSIFTSPDVDNLYILDSGNARLVVVTKTGQFVASYNGDKFGTASDLVADEVAKKVYLLDDNKIWTMDLK